MKYDYGGVEYEGDDFYCYHGSNVLLNKFDIRDGGNLQEIEHKMSYVNIVSLGENPLKGVLDLKYLPKIHKHITIIQTACPKQQNVNYPAL